MIYFERYLLFILLPPFFIASLTTIVLTELLGYVKGILKN